MRKTIIPIPNDELSIFEKKLSNIFCVYIVDLMMVRRWNIANWAQFLIFQIVRLLFGLNESKST